MQAVVFHAIGDIRLEDVPEPRHEVPARPRLKHQDEARA